MHLDADATQTYQACAVMSKERGPLGTRLNEEERQVNGREASKRRIESIGPRYCFGSRLTA